MKILLMGGSTKYSTEMNENSEIMPDCMEGYGMVWAFFITKYLKKKENVEIIFNSKTGNASRCPSLAVDSPIKVDSLYTDEWMAQIPEADHCIAFEQRCFYNRDNIFYTKLRKKIKGKITTICDHNRTIGPEDCTFYSRNVYRDNRKVPKSLFIGWAAEPTECYIDKDKSNISILIDHSYYSAYSSCKNKDYSVSIIKDVCKFSKQMKEDGHKETVVRRFVSGGVETLDVNNPWFEIYDRQGLNFRDAAKEDNKADIIPNNRIIDIDLGIYSLDTDSEAAYLY